MSDRWNKRNIIKNLIIENSYSVLKILLQFEIDGYPVYEVIKKHASYAMRDSYEEFVLRRYFAFCKMVELPDISSDDKKKFMDRIALVKVLPSFKQLDKERTRGDIWPVPLKPSNRTLISSSEVFL
jgi:hypothetical protein